MLRDGFRKAIRSDAATETEEESDILTPRYTGGYYWLFVGRDYPYSAKGVHLQGLHGTYESIEAAEQGFLLTYEGGEHWGQIWRFEGDKFIHLRRYKTDGKGGGAWQDVPEGLRQEIPVLRLSPAPMG